MKKNRLDVKYLDNIIKNTIEAVEKGQEEIFRIAEHAKRECERLHKELDQLKVRIADTIQTVDELQKQERASRYKLMVVSREFNKYGEEDIKAAYEHAREIQIKLTVEREREVQLREKRDEMERSYKNMQEMLKQAEELTLHIGVALNFLKGSLMGLSEKLTDINQKQTFAAQIIKAQEEERKFIAREIHDGPAQVMANILLQVDVCEKLYEKDVERARKELRELKELVRNCIREIRKIIFNLRPAALDDLGLEAVIRRYCAEFQEDTGVSVDLAIIGDKRRLDSTVEITLFRVIQEALSNIKKHARASNVVVKLEFAFDAVNLYIEDNGVGFQFEDVRLLSEDGGHFGLVNIRERVDLLKGTIRIRSEPGRGTGIYISIPLRERRN
ncbi:sensor histidine kinase [Thermosediminibacter litoriperuensis]|uniref:Oxygen sensor histidine kinase NreB n=1 Tax=Thermosediminibacter litoriperuensis TaxID=291989 RepID=A0A5S5AH20_9FIRM|nr:sensor histidine kinase [Thermosediminibacter litoriperuensis]TYP49277.1 two-component system sensor histidine kinase DegS [Thermosediminibacter litoriperuensis]